MRSFYIEPHQAAYLIGSQLIDYGRAYKYPKLRMLGELIRYYCSSTEGKSKGDRPLVEALETIKPTLDKAIRSVRIETKRKGLAQVQTSLEPAISQAIARFRYMPHLKLKLYTMTSIVRDVTLGDETAEGYELQSELIFPRVDSFYSSHELDEEAAHELVQLFRIHIVNFYRDRITVARKRKAIRELEKAINDFETAVIVEALV